jgi:hypothetical protein
VTHQRVAAVLSEYLDGSLAAHHAASVERHLRDCEACRCALQELRQTVELLRGLRGGVEAPDLSGVVMARIEAGDARPSLFERLRAGASRFLSTPLGAPLATAAVGLGLLAVLPRVEVEVSIPGRASAPAPAALAPSSAERAPSLRAASPPLQPRRVRESLSWDPFACLEAGPIDACREQHASLARLARQNVWAFVARVEEVPEAHRDDWLRAFSRFAARSGEAPELAARLRATGDPKAQRIAVRVEQAH